MSNKFIYIFSDDVLIVLFRYGVLVIHMFLIKFCKPELQPADRCKTSEKLLINWICRKKKQFFPSPFNKFLQKVT